MYAFDLINLLGLRLEDATFFNCFPKVTEITTCYFSFLLDKKGANVTINIILIKQ